MPMSGGRAVQRRQAELGGTRDHVLPLGAGADAGAAGVRVDLDALEPVGLQQDGVLERAERPGVVAGPLRRDAEALGSREAHDLGDVVRGPRERDRGRPLVGQSG